MSHAPIRITGDMTIYRAGEIKNQIVDALAREAQLEANLDEVTRIDCTGIQLLAAARAEAERQEKSFRVASVSKPVSDMVSLLNLGHLIDAPLIVEREEEPTHG